MSGAVPGGWKPFFWLACLYNLVIGLGAFLAAPWGSPDAVSAVLVACFGIVYGLVARDPVRFAPVLIAGIVGKAMVVLMIGLPNWRVGGGRSGTRCHCGRRPAFRDRLCRLPVAAIPPCVKFPGRRASWGWRACCRNWLAC